MANKVHIFGTELGSLMSFSPYLAFFGGQYKIPSCSHLFGTMDNRTILFSMVFTILKDISHQQVTKTVAKRKPINLKIVKTNTEKNEVMYIKTKVEVCSKCNQLGTFRNTQGAYWTQMCPVTNWAKFRLKCRISSHLGSYIVSLCPYRVILGKYWILIRHMWLKCVY